MIISLDTETTGIDLYHGASPFLVTTCNEEGEIKYWEWDVNPLTRKPIIPLGDIEDILEYVDSAELLIFQNAKFDITALRLLDKRFVSVIKWAKVHDTLLSGHLLASGHPHNLTDMAIQYLGIDIEMYEKDVHLTTNQARAKIRSQYPDWRIAKAGDEMLPSAKGTEPWKFDMWLPRTFAKEQHYEENHKWHSVTSIYANADSAVTLQLFACHQQLMKDRGLYKIYLERLKLISITQQMERTGITCSIEAIARAKKQYAEEAQIHGRQCVSIAMEHGVELELPKSGNNSSLISFAFEKLVLPVVSVSKKTGNPSLDKNALNAYRDILPPDSQQSKFVTALQSKRKRDTAVGYLESYCRFLKNANGSLAKMHPSLNYTGTSTLRWSSSNPNEQNISKQEDVNLRSVIVPAKGRELWSLDYQNIELRIPAYESNERVMIELFEKPDEPPYYGSYHLLNASIIYPDLFWPLAEKKGAFKKKYASTWYQWVKNFGFAVSYGAIEQSGTADRAAHKPGAQKLVMNRLKEHTALNNSMIAYARSHGYVETLPDKEVDPKRGYPIECPSDLYGRVSPTVPLNFHVQSTACWVMMRAMIKVHNYLKETTAAIIMQIHDELVIETDYKPNMGSLPLINKVAALMCSVGDCIGIPLTVGIEYHKNNWGEGVSA